MPKRGVLGLLAVALTAYWSGRKQGRVDGEIRGYGKALRAFTVGLGVGRNG